MQKTTKLRITTTRKRIVNFSISTHRGFCPECKQEVQALSRQQAADLLETGQPQLASLIATGKLHAVRSVGGAVGICQESLTNLA